MLHRFDDAVGLLARLADGGEIDLDFGLCAGRADDELCLALQAVLEHLRLGKARVVVLIVDRGNNLPACQLRRLFRAQPLHEIFHRLHAGHALEREAAKIVPVVAVFLIQTVDRVAEIHTLLRVVGGSLHDEKRRVDCVLVAYMCAGKVAVALLEAENVPGFFSRRLEVSDLLADELKAREDAPELHTVALGHRVDHICRNDRRHSHRSFGHMAVCDTALADIVQQDHTHLVAGNEPVAALVVGNGRTAAVAVRVGAK